MSSRHEAAAVAAVVLSAALMLPAVAAAEVPRTARLTLNRGDEFRSAGQHRRAIEAYRSGLRELVHWGFLLRIADTYRRLGHCEIAVDYMRLGLMWRNETFAEENRAAVEVAIGECSAEIPARLEVSADVGEATVVVDGEPAGSAPTAAPLEVSAGVHNVEVTRDGYSGSPTVVRTENGRVAFARLTLVAESGAGPEAAAQNSTGGPEPSAASRRRGRILGGLFLGLGLAFGGGGGALIAIDGRDVGNDTGLATLAPGTILAGLGAGMIAGGIAFLAAPPPADEP